MLTVLCPCVTRTSLITNGIQWNFQLRILNMNIIYNKMNITKRIMFLYDTVENQAIYANKLYEKVTQFRYK